MGNLFPSLSQYTEDFSGFKHTNVPLVFDLTEKSDDFSGFVSNTNETHDNICNNHDINAFEGFQHFPAATQSLLSDSILDTSFFENLFSSSTSLTSYAENVNLPCNDNTNNNHNDNVN